MKKTTKKTVKKGAKKVTMTEAKAALAALKEAQEAYHEAMIVYVELLRRAVDDMHSPAWEGSVAEFLDKHQLWRQYRHRGVYRHPIPK